MTKDILSEQINEETYEVGSGRVHDIASPVPSPHGISKCHAVCLHATLQPGSSPELQGPEFLLGYLFGSLSN